MTTKADYTSEDWDILLRPIANAATNVIAAEMLLVVAFKEMKALGDQWRKSYWSGRAEHCTPLDLLHNLKNKNISTGRIYEVNRR